MTLNLSGSTGVSGVDGSAATPALQGSDTNTGISFGTDVIIASTDGSERARIDSSGRLGLGTSTFTDNNALLHVSKDASGSTGGSIVIRNGAANASGNMAELVFKTSSGFSNGFNSAKIAAIQPSASETSDLAFYTYGSGTGTERMRIDNAGLARFFGQAGVIYSRSATGAGTSERFYIGYHSATSTTTGGTIAFNVYTNGNVENTNNSYTGISDIKLKDNIVDANSQWADIKALRPVNYNFKPETGHETFTQLGLIAQEVELVSPGLVSESPDRDEDGNDLGTVTKSVNYSVLYMKAVKALQEAMERIETLEASNTDLLARVSALESA